MRNSLILNPQVLLSFFIVLTGLISGCSTLSTSEPSLVGGDFVRLQEMDTRPATPSATSRSMAYFSLGLNRELQRDYAGAIEAFQQAIRTDPENDALYMIASERLVKANRSEDALILLQTLVEKQPGNAVAHRWLAKLYLQKGLADKAQAEMLTAVNCLPESEGIYLEALQMALSQQDIELALDILRKANLHAKDALKSTEYLIKFLAAELKKSPDVKRLVELEDEREQILKKAIVDFPETKIFTFIQAETFIDQSKWDLALQSYAELDQRYASGLKIREEILLHALRSLGGGRGGVQTLEKALNRHLETGFTYYLLGLLKEITGAPSAARTAYKQALEMDEGSQATLLKLAVLSYQTNQKEEALRYIEQSLENSPEDPEALLLAGQISLSSGDYTKAKTYLEKRLYLSRQGKEIENPDLLYSQLSMTFFALNENRQLIEDAMVNASETAGNLEWIWRFQLGRIFITRETDEAKADRMQDSLLNLLEDVADRLPANPEVEWLIGRMHGMRKDHSKMLQAYERYLDLALHHPESDLWLSDDFYFDLAAAYERTGNVTAAVETFETIIARTPQHHPSLNYLAYMWAERSENLSQAEHYVKRALELDPDNGSYLDTLGWVYYQQGKFEAALQKLLRSAELEPKESVILEHLGDVLMKLGRPWEARGYYRIALILDTTNERRTLIETSLQQAEMEVSNLVN